MFYRSISGFLLFSAFSINIVFALPKAIWCPTFSQQAQNNYETCPGLNPCPTATRWANPDFNPGETGGNRDFNVLVMVDAAYQKGIRTLDIDFDSDPLYQPATTDPAETAYNTGVTETGMRWVRAIIYENKVHPTDKMALRVRVRVDYNSIVSVYFRTGRNGTTRSSPCPKIYYETGTRPPEDNQIDFGDPAIRAYIGGYTTYVLDGINAELSNPVIPANARTQVDEVSLALDAGGESGLTAISGEPYPLLSYSNAHYPGSGASLQSKISYYKARQSVLHDLYARFAAAVTARSINGATPLPAIFMQTWAFDGRDRGIFDLASALKGTGIKVIHHTQSPLSFDQSLRSVSFTSSVAKWLGISFDTEFSWAHFPGDPLGCLDGKAGVVNMCWNQSLLKDDYADRFYFQAEAGFRYGANGMTYANWTGYDVKFPPDRQSWNNLVGKPQTDQWNSDHLTRAGSGSVPPGLFTYAPWPSATKAIYVSTVGRVNCEENGSCYKPYVYWNWFSNFGIDFLHEKVDIITDQMIKDASNPSAFFGKYKMIYLPYETGAYTDPTVFSKLDTYFYTSGGWNIWYQESPNSTVRGNYGKFRNRTLTGISSF